MAAVYLFERPSNRVHRVATSAWRTFSDVGKISPGWWGGGARPPPLITFTLTSKVAVYAPAEWADTLTLFHLYQYMYSVGPPLLGRTRNFVGSESGQIQSVKILIQYMLSNTAIHSGRGVLIRRKCRWTHSGVNFKDEDLCIGLFLPIWYTREVCRKHHRLSEEKIYILDHKVAQVICGLWIVKKGLNGELVL